MSLVAVAAVALAACVPAPSGPTAQLVTVDAPSATSTAASVRIWRRDGRCWTRVGGPWPAHVGRNGLSRSHREGDGTTPLGDFGFGSVAYGLDPDPGTRLRYHRLVCGDWWDEDPASPTYNTFLHEPCGARPPSRRGTEALWLARTAYRLFAVVDYNAHPIVPGRGSAIFLHVDLGRPTNGCVSLARSNLARVLRWLRPDASPRIAIRLRG